MIAIAVANEEVIAEPDAPARSAIALLLGTGSLLFLASYARCMQVITGRWATIHAIGLGILALTAAVSFFMPAYTALLATSAVLLVVAVLDQRRSRFRARATLELPTSRVIGRSRMRFPVALNTSPS